MCNRNSAQMPATPGYVTVANWCGAVGGGALLLFAGYHVAVAQDDVAPLPLGATTLVAIFVLLLVATKIMQVVIDQANAHWRNRLLDDVREAIRETLDNGDQETREALARNQQMLNGVAAAVGGGTVHQLGRPRN